MAHPDAERWNTRYLMEADAWLEREPRQLLREFAHLLPACGLALDAAGGVANNGLFLAEHGLHVVVLDISEVALRLARQRARALSLPLEAAVYDLSRPWLPADTFDVIVNFRFLERATFAVYRRALKPGGLLFFETFLAGGDEAPYPKYFLQSGELEAAFQTFDIYHSAEMEIRDNDGHVIKKTGQLVARKK